MPASSSAVIPAQMPRRRDVDPLGRSPARRRSARRAAAPTRAREQLDRDRRRARHVAGPRRRLDDLRRGASAGLGLRSCTARCAPTSRSPTLRHRRPQDAGEAGAAARQIPPATRPCLLACVPSATWTRLAGEPVEGLHAVAGGEDLVGAIGCAVVGQRSPPVGPSGRPASRASVTSGPMPSPRTTRSAGSARRRCGRRAPRRRRPLDPSTGSLQRPRCPSRHAVARPARPCRRPACHRQRSVDERTSPARGAEPSAISSPM